ncbi:MAG: hypothetical protein LBT75_05040 [Bacilli bacterium]|jgi:hypothetical protein|nr:hypothetical protein [Bacilli bacterium]
MSEILNFLNHAHVIILFAIILGFLAIGDIITKITKGLIPGLLVFVIILAATSWSGMLPPKIVEMVGLTGPISAFASIVIVINMGTTLDLKDITNNWKVAVLGLVALVGVAIGCCTIGALIFGWDKAVVAAPVVGGGIVAALEMQSSALEMGQDALASMAVLILTLQSLPAYVIIPPLFKKVMREDLDSKTEDEIVAAANVREEEDAKMTTLLPDNMWTTNTILFAVCLVGILAVVSNMLAKQFMGQYAISTSIFSLLYGVIFTQLRILPRDATARAGSSGIIFFIVIVNAISSIASSNPDTILKLLFPIAGLIFFGILGILIVCSVVGKLAFKYDWKLSFIMGLNCLLGFPLNYMLVLDAIEFSARNEKEKEYLTCRYVPMMLVAGFVTVTIGSVLLAGVMKGFL